MFPLLKSCPCVMTVVSYVTALALVWRTQATDEQFPAERELYCVYLPSCRWRVRWKRDPDTLQGVEDLEVQAVSAAEKGTLEDAFELHLLRHQTSLLPVTTEHRYQRSLGTRPSTLGGMVWSCAYIPVVPRTEC